MIGQNLIGCVMGSKKMKKLEKKLSYMKHSMEVIRTVVPVLVLILQVLILGRVL